MVKVITETGKSYEIRQMPASAANAKAATAKPDGTVERVLKVFQTPEEARSYKQKLDEKLSEKNESKKEAEKT